MKAASCSCTIKVNNACLFLFGDKTLLDETEAFHRDNTKAICIAVATKMRQWGNRYGAILEEEQGRLSLRLQVCIDGKNHVFQRFTDCRRFLSAQAASAPTLENSSYVSLPRLQKSRSL